MVVTTEQQYSDFEDVQSPFGDIRGGAGREDDDNRGGSFTSSLAATLALATAHEQEQRRKRTIVESIVDTIVFVLGAAETNAEDDDSEVHPQALRNELIGKILQDDDDEDSTTAGSTILAAPVVLSSSSSSSTSSASELFRTTWNNNQHLTLHWVWEKHTRRRSTTNVSSSTPSVGDYYHYYSCNVSVIFKAGMTIELFSPALDENDPRSTTPIATCAVSTCQWTLEGCTDATNSMENTHIMDDNNHNTIRSFWKIEQATLSYLVSSSVVGASVLTDTTMLPTEEEVLIGSNISLMGVGLSKINTTNGGIHTDSPRCCRFLLQSNAVLDMHFESFVTGGILGEDEKIRVGQALRSFVAYLDQMRVPQLNLTITTTASIDNDECEIPSFHSNDDTKMGDVIRYYLRTYCDTNNNTTAATSTNRATTSSSSKFMTMPMLPSGDRLKAMATDSVTTFGALAVTGASLITPLGAVVSVAALAAKDGVTAAALKGKAGVSVAAQKGKEVRISKQRERVLIQNATNSSSNTVEGRDSVTNRISLNFEPDEAGVSTTTGVPSPTAVHPVVDGDRYQIGDVARGFIGSIREKRQQQSSSTLRTSSLSTIGSSLNSTADNTDTSSSNNSKRYLQENKGRFAGVAGASAGAAAGMLVAGPLGAIAGSVIGSMGTQVAVKKHKQSKKHEKSGLERSSDGDIDDNADARNDSFRFGDNIRNTVARGKELSGRNSSSSFQFGDFSRGLIRSTREDRSCSNKNESKNNDTVASNTSAVNTNTSGNHNNDTKPYRFGDFSRGLLAKGKDVVAERQKSNGSIFGGGIFANATTTTTTRTHESRSSSEKKPIDRDLNGNSSCKDELSATGDNNNKKCLQPHANTFASTQESLNTMCEVKKNECVQKSDVNANDDYDHDHDHEMVPTLLTMDHTILMEIFGLLEAIDILNVAQINLSMYNKIDLIFGISEDGQSPPTPQPRRS